MSSSRGSGCEEISRARPSRRLVSPAMAEGTTTTWRPARCHLATRSATLRMRSTEPIEVPPYFWTMRDIGLVFRGCWRRCATPQQGHAAPFDHGKTLDYRRCRPSLQEALARVASLPGLEAQPKPGATFRP